MLEPSKAMFVLASHTMPDLLISLVYFALTWSAAPVLVFASLGAGLGWKSIGWRQICGAAWGLLIGLLTVLPFVFLAVPIIFIFARWWPGLIAAEFLGILAGSWVASRVARIGRPAPPGMTLETLNQNLTQIERIVREQLSEAGIETGPALEMNAVANAEILSHQQLALLLKIRQMRNRFMQSRVISHDEVASWAGKSRELLDELSVTSTDGSLTHTGGDRSNPYLPPGHRNTHSSG